MTRDLSDIANSIQAAYEEMYSEELNEKMEYRKAKLSGKKLYTNPNQHFTPSEKKAIEGINRNIASWDKKDSEDKEEKSPVEGSLKTGIKRKTNMRNVIVARYLHDEGFTDTLESAEIMAEVISEEWVEEIVNQD